VLPEIWYDEKNEVVRIKFTEVWTEEDIPDLFKRIRENVKKSPHKQLIGDVSEAAPQNYTKAHRKMVAEEAPSLGLDKIAILGANPVLRMMAKVLLSVIKKRLTFTARFFNTDEDALAWLREGK